ncbi:MAG: hypothetical protein ISQ13_03035 [Candidatus Margulisbacteria bacterium]|nr:hypothetical protein [Candidatus Margulisiibacteriota bacterium]
MVQFLFLIIFSISVFASPTIYGPTGLIEMPSAQSIAYKQVNFAVDYALNNDEEGESKNNFFYKFNLGSFENWELGILGGSFLDEGVFVNMKYFLMSNQEENPLSIAAGLERIGSNSDLATYLVTSKRFDGGLHGHFGFKAYLQDSLYASAMLGFEYFSDEKVSFLVDITGEKNEAYVLNGGTKIFIDPDVSLRIYLVDITKNRAAQETLYTFGLSISKYI